MFGFQMTESTTYITYDGSLKGFGVVMASVTETPSRNIVEALSEERVRELENWYLDRGQKEESEEGLVLAVNGTSNILFVAGSELFRHESEPRAAPGTP